jgi:hypothetical protein
MNLKVSLKAENGLFNCLNKKFLFFFGYRHKALHGASWRHMVPYDGTTWRQVTT